MNDNLAFGLDPEPVEDAWKRVVDFLVENRTDWTATGSFAFFGDRAACRDRDFVLWWGDLPEAVQEDIARFNNYARPDYTDAFINIKEDDFDFILLKSQVQFDTWKFATEAMALLTAPGVAFEAIDLEHKPTRVDLFEMLKTFAAD